MMGEKGFLLKKWSGMKRRKMFNWKIDLKGSDCKEERLCRGGRVVPCRGKRLEQNIFWGKEEFLRVRIFLSVVFPFPF